MLALLVTGYTINIMSVIGIILLFGLVTKNSILLVDLTIQKQETGLDREEALRVACPIRLRPILMTAVSMIFGVLPVALALGEGGEALEAERIAGEPLDLEWAIDRDGTLIHEPDDFQVDALHKVRLVDDVGLVEVPSGHAE